MSFLVPSAFALGLLVPVIVAMYLLKLRRTEQPVSSVYLWRRMVRDVEANAPWQRLKANLLLILQLLFLIALIFALARPFTLAEGAGGQAEILIVDTSASMGATDVAPNRLEAAKEQARQLIGSLPDQARVTVIAAGQTAEVRAASSQDRRQALQAVEDLHLEAGSSDLSVALELASAIAARQPETEIVVLSDGGVQLPERMALKGSLRYLPIGLREENQAISALTLEPGSGGQGATAFVQVTNYGQQAAERRLNLYADGALFNVYDLSIPSGGQRAVLAEDLPAEAGRIEARLDPAEEGVDVLPSDDRALALRPPGQPAQVLVISSGNLFLAAGLDNLLESPPLFLTPEEFESGEVLAEEEFEPDLTIFDNYVPITASLPAGNLFFIAPLRSTEYFSVTGKVDQPAPRLAVVDDPLLRYVSVADVSVLDAVRIPMPLWARPLVAGDLSAAPADTGGPASTPLLFAGETEGRRIAVLSFDLQRSDLPLTLAYPVLLANLTGWLAPQGGTGLPGQVLPGESVTLGLPPEIEQVSVLRPDGSRVRLEPQGGQVIFTETNQAGLYRLEWGQDGQAEFVVNPFLPGESNVTPADQLPGVGAGLAGGEGTEGRSARREWWRPLAALALGLLTAEWLVYQRAGLARLRDQTLATLRR